MLSQVFMKRILAKSHRILMMRVEKKEKPIFFLIFVFFTFFSATTQATENDFWPWSSQNPEKPPEFKPYRLPTFHPNAKHFNKDIPALEKAPRVDADELFKQILNCYPAPSKWKIDINLQAAARTGSVINIDGTSIGKNYVGIVAQMPLYSATELDREREREYRRRTETAQVVASFVAAIASRNHAVREMGLYSSLESRSRIRVGQGIASTSEQIQFLEKVAAAQESLIKTETKIMESRLILVGMCEDHKADPINHYLSSLAQLPKSDPQPNHLIPNKLVNVHTDKDAIP